MTKTIDLDDLTPDPRNARRRTTRSAALLAQSMEQFGAARSIVIDEVGQVIAGNGTVEAAAAAGITKVQVVDADGSTLVAVRRSGLSPAQKASLALADNRTAELAEWDIAVLDELAESQPDVLADWFTSADLDALHDLTDNVEQDQDDNPGDDPADHDPTQTQPLAIILSPQQMRLWRATKAALGVSTDTAALLRLMEAYGHG
jgi:hypothetical protein